MNPSDFAENQGFALLFERGIPSPVVIPDAGDDLMEFLAQHHRGLSRITIKYEPVRRQFQQVNALTIGASYNETPSASIIEISRAIMSVAQDHHESVADTCKYYIQCHVFKREGGNAIRKAHYIQLGDGTQFGDVMVESSRSSEAFDEMQSRQFNTMFDKCMLLCDVVAGMGKEAIKHQGTTFQAQEEALLARNEANMVVIEARREDADGKRKDQKVDRAFSMLEKAFKTGLAQNAAAGIKAKLGLGTGAPAPVLPPNLPSTPAPAWAAQARGETPAAEAEVVQPPPVALEPEPEPEPADVVDTTAEEVPDYEETEEIDMSHKEQAAALYASITAAQWPDLMDALTKKQFAMLRALEAPETDEAALAGVAKFRGSLKQATQDKVAHIMTPEQITALIMLAMSVTDDDGDEGE